MVDMIIIAVGILLFSLHDVAIAASLPCALRQYPTGLLCVCNTTYCDTLEFQNPTTPCSFFMVSSDLSGARFKETSGRFSSFVSPAAATITVNHAARFQTFLGFGGAFTGSVAYNLALLAPGVRHGIYRSYYDSSVGIGYNFMRIPIGGSDFDLAPWAYNELPENDAGLTNFTKLDDRDVVKVAQIKELMSVTGRQDIKFIGAAWSPPRWMKTNNDWSGFNFLKPEYYQTWADYHVKYLTLMKNAGLNYWAISTGNEPLNGVIGFLFIFFMNLGWTASSQGQWVAQNLGPTLRNSAFKNVKLFAGDDQRYTIPGWFVQMDQGNPSATSYVDGMAYHWYLDQLIPPTVFDVAANLYPGKLLFNTEASLVGNVFQSHSSLFGSWDSAEKYITYIMQDLQHSVQGWIDWNLALDEIGGPNYVQNYLQSAMVVNSTSGQEVYKQPIFYALGHFSRFITEGSTRFDAISSDPGVLVVGFDRPDQRSVLVFYNTKLTPVDLVINDPTRGSVRLMIAPKSIQSLLYA